MDIIPIDSNQDGRKDQALYLAGCSRIVIHDQKAGRPVCICLGKNLADAQDRGVWLVLAMNSLGMDFGWDEQTQGPKYALLDYNNDPEGWADVVEVLQKALDVVGSVQFFVDGGFIKFMVFQDLVFDDYVDLVNNRANAVLDEYNYQVAFERDLKQDIAYQADWIKMSVTRGGAWLHQALRAQFEKELQTNLVLFSHAAISDVVVFKGDKYYLTVNFTGIRSVSNIRGWRLIQAELKRCFEDGMVGAYERRPMPGGHEWPI